MPSLLCIKVAVISGCDMIGTGAEVRRRVAQQRSRGINFDNEYLPPEFDMGGQPLDVAELLQPSHRTRVPATATVFGLSKPELVQLAVLGVLIAAGIIGWLNGQNHQDQIAKEAAFQAEQQRLAELASTAKNPVWNRRPSA